MKAAAKNQTTIIRNPQATRPWQHVLEPLSGYLMLGMELLKGDKSFATSWNFGPDDSSNLSVKAVCDKINKFWKESRFSYPKQSNAPHEATLLKLDCSKAKAALKWHPVWDGDTCFDKTTNWYKTYYANKIINTKDDLASYINAARDKNIRWTL